MPSPEFGGKRICRRCARPCLLNSPRFARGVRKSDRSEDVALSLVNILKITVEPISKIFQPALRAILPERKARREDNSQSYGSDRGREATPRSGSMAATLRDQARLLQGLRFCARRVSAGYAFVLAPCPCGNEPRSRAEYFRDRFLAEKRE